MKNAFLAVLACISITRSISSYTHTVFNTTPGEVRIKLNEVLCRNDNVTLKPGESKEIDVAGCITSSIEARGLSGPVAGMTVVKDTQGNKASGYEWYIKLVDFKTTNSDDRVKGININLGGAPRAEIIPGTGRLEIEQR